MGCCFGSRKKKESDDAKKKCKAPEAPDRPPTEPATQSQSQSQLQSQLQSLPPSTGPDNRRNAQIFTYEELVVATNDFSPDTFLGQGGFGCVYKGQLQTGQVVAVKKLDHSGLQGDQEFLVEVLMLSLLRHPNLVNLIGYCAEGDQRLLVYEYMPFGALEEHLHDLQPGAVPLSWNVRMMIAAGTAKGLEYLHCGADPPVIFRDMKTANILLDEEYRPKLSDFGLAKFGPTGDKTHVTTRVMGTQGYCAPEYYETGKLTMKSDIYSFGVVLLELITGRRALDNSRPSPERYLIDWARPYLLDKKNCTLIADPLLRGRYSLSTLRKALDLTAMCLQETASARPTTRDLAQALEFLAAPRLGEPSRTPSPRNVASTSTSSNSPGALERQRAVADAKQWGQKWRDYKSVTE